MFSISNEQLISVWAQLERALRGEHGFGGDVAEIYCYLVEARDPLLDSRPRVGELGHSDWLERAKATAEALRWIFRRFLREYPGTTMEIDGRSLEEWEIEQVPKGEEYRLHVMVSRPVEPVGVNLYEEGQAALEQLRFKALTVVEKDLGLDLKVESRGFGELAERLAEEETKGAGGDPATLLVLEAAVALAETSPNVKLVDGPGAGGCYALVGYLVREAPHVLAAWRKLLNVDARPRGEATVEEVGSKWLSTAEVRRECGVARKVVARWIKEAPVRAKLRGAGDDRRVYLLHSWLVETGRLKK